MRSNSKKRSRRGKSRQRTHRPRLKTEMLETRVMLSADFGHNMERPADVNNDGLVSAIDALVTINSLNNRTQINEDMFVDVNDDGACTAIDALMVINQLNNTAGADGAGQDGGRPGGAPDGTPEGNLEGRPENIPEGEPAGNPAGIRGGNPGGVPGGNPGGGPGANPGGNPGGDGSQGMDGNDVEEGEVRTIDGTGNNLENPELGSTGETLMRVAENDYADGISEPAGDDRPSAREISNLISAADLDGTANDRDLSAFVYVWGQFLDHDIDRTPSPEGDAPREAFDIAVPSDDALFDPFGTGEVTIPFARSEFDADTGTSTDNPREQFNAITAWIDGSQVYGSDQETADSLREFSGGRLLISDDGLVPIDEEGHVLAGDVRAGENVALTAMQSLFVREHNRLAEEFAADNPEASDEQIYQGARAQVIGLIQSITYNEYLPALLGDGALSRYEGYDATIDPSIANEFSTAAFRFGHSTLNDDVEFFGNDGRAVRDEVALAEAFFNPALLQETGIDSILKYDASTLAQEIDLEVVDSVRNFLFGPPGAGGLDLAALNIQRGRDHGLADYNATRQAYGLDAIESFDQLTSDVELQEKLESLYGGVDNIDLWVGMMAEDHLPGASVGELTSTVITDQFERLRDGDRFWYQNTFQGRTLRELQQTSLADVIQRNTDVEGLQDNVFFFQAEVGGTVRAQPDASDGPANRGRRRDDLGVSGVEVQLLDDEGNLVESTVTDQRGNYQFDSFDETGDYQVRIVATDSVEPVGDDTLDLLVSSGDVQLRGLNFQIIV